MALRVLELKKKLDEYRAKIAAGEEKLSGFSVRSAELNEKIENAETEEEKGSIEAEIDAFNSEKADVEKEVEKLRDLVDETEAELDEIESKQPSSNKRTIERKIEKMDINEIRSSEAYINAYANYIKTGKADEVRALLTENADTNGQLPVPSIVDGIVRTAWDRETIMSAVNKTYLKGNVKVGFEISATGAVVHREGGTAASEETLQLGIVTMIPANIKKWITVSDEAISLNGEAFLNYIYSELTYQIAKKAADMLVIAISTAPAASSATAAGQAELTAAIAQDTIVSALGKLSDEAVNPVVIMNKATYSAFKAAQYSGNFNADIFEGLEVKFNNTLPAYSSASTGNVYAIVGDLSRGAQVNLPNGDTIDFVYDELSLAEKDLVKIVGKEYVGIGVVAPNAFCKIKKPASV